MEICKLNTLRGLAAFIVIITHFSDKTAWLDGVLGGSAGQYGVMLFFMLSGFFMSYLYFDQKTNNTNVRKYLVARGARILPLYLLVVLLSSLMPFAGWEGLYNISDIKTLAAHLLFIKGESVLWTIAPEIQFYILFLGLWALNRWRFGYVHLLVFASLILLFFSNFPRPNGEVNGLPYDIHLFRSLPYFLVGTLFGMHYKSFQVPSYMKSHWFAVILLLIPLLYPEFSPVNSSAKYRMWLNYEVLLVMSSVFFCILFMVPDNNPILVNKVGDFVGKISFSLYLLHMPLIIQLNNLNITVELKLVMFLLLSLIVAYLSYRFVEKPMSRWLRGQTRIGPTSRGTEGLAEKVEPN